MFKRFLYVCLSTFWLGTSWAAAPLLSAGELSALLKQPQSQANPIRVIDIRKASSYKDNHIEIASNSPFEEWRGSTTTPAQLPSLDKLTQLMQKHGLTATTPS